VTPASCRVRSTDRLNSPTHADDNLPVQRILDLVSGPDSPQPAWVAKAMGRVNAMSTPLMKEFVYNAPIENVWQALTDTKCMREWYFPQLKRFEPIVGFKFQFDTAGAEYEKEWIVTKISEGRTLAHSWAYKGYPGSSETTFDLFPEGDTTRLRVTRTDLESFPNDPHFRRERFERGWDDILGQNLKHLLERSNSS
jgi:uncharacterized protein YndB with AHSA1/START domain